MTSELPPPRTKAELEQEMDRGWSAIEAMLSELAESQLTEPTDAAGWTIKDHLAHLAAWERSMVYLLQGKPRHEGLGVTRETYEGDVDTLNAAIHEASRDLSLEAVLTVLRTTHETLRNQVAGMSEADLQQTGSHFLPGEPGDDDGRPVLDRISGNAGSHFSEHLSWMEAIATG